MTAVEQVIDSFLDLLSLNDLLETAEEAHFEIQDGYLVYKDKNSVTRAMVNLGGYFL